MLLPEQPSDLRRRVARMSSEALKVLGPILGALLSVPMVGIDRAPDAVFGRGIKADTARARRVLENHVGRVLAQVYEDDRARVDAALSDFMEALRDEITVSYDATRSSLQRDLTAGAAAEQSLLHELEGALSALHNLRSAT